MTGDLLTFQRATRVSLTGLMVQAALTIAALIYGRLGSDHAATTLAIYNGVGLVVWAGLLLYFDQRRRERIEAMEVEALTSESSTSAFSDSDDELRVTARRVRTIQRWVIPGLGVVCAAVLILAGLARFEEARTLTNPDVLGQRGADLPGWGIAVGLGLAFIGFVFARFTSGMASQKDWTPLAAGAAQTVGAAIFGILIAIGHFVDMAIGPDTVVLYTPAIMSVAMILLGAEIVLNVLFDLYRPRQPGAGYQPAFGSRLLGLFAAPDRVAESVGDALQYQFGVDVTSTWFYRLLSRSLMILAALGLLVGWLMTSVIIVEPHQRAIVLNRGEISRPIFSLGEVSGDTDVGPGLHITLPWPWGGAVVPEYIHSDHGSTTVSRTSTGIRTIHLGTNPPTPGTGPILWDKAHTEDEILNIVQPAGASVLDLIDDQALDTLAGVDRAGNREISGDVGLLAIEIPVQFTVADVEKYERLAGPGQRERILQAVGSRVVMRRLMEMRLDEVLSEARITLADELRTELEAAFGDLNDGEGAGVEIVFVGAGGVHPPTKAAGTFERVIQARQNAEAMLESALAQEIQVLSGVAGSVELARTAAEQIDEIERLEGSEAAELALDIQKQLERAGGLAGTSLTNAGAARWTRHMGERARAERYLGRIALNDAAPRLYRTSLYFDALLDAMADARVIINGVGEGKTRIDLQDKESLNVFDPTAGEGMN